jgi:hypothetical protein
MSMATDATVTTRGYTCYSDTYGDCGVLHSTFRDTQSHQTRVKWREGVCNHPETVLVGSDGYLYRDRLGTCRCEDRIRSRDRGAIRFSA